MHPTDLHDEPCPSVNSTADYVDAENPRRAECVSPRARAASRGLIQRLETPGSLIPARHAGEAQISPVDRGLGCGM